MWKSKILLIACLVLTLFGCSNKLEINNLSIEKQPKFGGIYIHSTIEEFNKYGFEYGDSLDFSFSNGYELTDIPYYDGFYMRRNKLLLVAYPGYPYICLSICNGGSMYEQAQVDDTVTVSIKLNEKGKYIDAQNALKMAYTNDRNNYESDEIFTNFRCVEGGNFGPNILYRSASPCDNSYNRAVYTDKLIKEYNIQTILDIADTIEETDDYYNDPNLDCPNWKNLYENNHVFVQELSNDYSSDTFKDKVKNIAQVIIENDGPYLLHCTEGKDRTGFVCILFEALMNYSEKEIIDDYMKTYENYYGINNESDRNKYDAIVETKFKDLIECLTRNTNNLVEAAKYYLLECGLTEQEIDKLIIKLS